MRQPAAGGAGALARETNFSTLDPPAPARAPWRFDLFLIHQARDRSSARRCLSALEANRQTFVGPKKEHFYGTPQRPVKP